MGVEVDRQHIKEKYFYRHCHLICVIHRIIWINKGRADPLCFHFPSQGQGLYVSSTVFITHNSRLINP